MINNFKGKEYHEDVCNVSVNFFVIVKFKLRTGYWVFTFISKAKRKIRLCFYFSFNRGKHIDK
jgi:hypothetical protein